MKNIFIYIITLYRRIPLPYKIFSCRHYPSCSEYAVEAIKTNGAIIGGVQSLWRILRCNPFSRSVYDPPKEYRHGITK